MQILTITLAILKNLQKNEQEIGIISAHKRQLNIVLMIFGKNR